MNGGRVSRPPLLCHPVGVYIYMRTAWHELYHTPLPRTFFALSIQTHCVDIMSDSPASSTSPPLGSRPYTEIDRTFGRHFHAPFHAQRQTVSSAPNTRKMMPPYLKTLTALGKLPPTRTLENCSTNGGNYQGVMLDGEDPRWAWEPVHEYKFPDQKWCLRHSDYDGSHLKVYRRILAHPVTEELLRMRFKDPGSAVASGWAENNLDHKSGSSPLSNDLGATSPEYQQSSGPESDNYKVFFDCATNYSDFCRPTGPWYDPEDPTVGWEPVFTGDYMEELYCKEHHLNERFVESIYRKVPGNPRVEASSESLLPSHWASNADVS